MDGGRRAKTRREPPLRQLIEEPTRRRAASAPSLCTPASRGQSSVMRSPTPIHSDRNLPFLDTQELRDHFERRIEREEYGRYGNPTQHIAEQKLAALEAPGIAALRQRHGAVTTTLYAVLSHNLMSS